MFINLAGAGITVFAKDTTRFVPKEDVVDTFYEVMIDVFAQLPTPPSDIYIINGPWSFTTIRTGTLVINTLIEHHKIPSNIFVCNKLSLFTTLRDHKLIPSQWYLRIGQKKNMRMYDIPERKTTIIAKDKIQKNSADTFKEHYHPWQSAEPHHVAIKWYDEKNIIVTYQTTQHKLPLTAFPRQQTPKSIAAYLLDAVQQ